MQQDKTIQKQIESLRALTAKSWISLRRKRTFSVLLGAVTGLLLFFTVLLFIEHSSYLSPLLKTVVAGLAALTALIAGIRIAKKLPPRSHNLYYRSVTRQTGLDSLRHLLDLSDSPRSGSGPFLEPALKQNLGNLDHDLVGQKFANWNASTPEHTLSKRFGLASIILLLTITVFSLQHPETAYRSLTFWETYEKPNPFEFTIEPGNATVEQGNRFYASIDFTGPKPERVGLAIKTEVEDQYRIIPMQETTPGRFVSESVEVFNNISYYIRMDKFRSEIYDITASRLPRFRELIVSATPPAYTEMEPVNYTYPFSRIEVPEGTEFRIKGTANKALEQIELKRKSSGVILLDEDDELTWSTSFTITKTDTLSFAMIDFEGLDNRNPFNFIIRAIPDQHPTVRITAPEPVLQKLNPKTVDLRFEARDDYGFSSIHLRYEIHEAYSDAKQRGSIRLSGRAPASVNATREWDISDLNLQPLDELVYWIEVFDNDEVNGYKSAVSARQIIRAASLAEHLLEQEEKEDNIENKLDDLARQSEEAREELRQLREDIIQNPDQNWEQQRQTEELMQQQQEMNEFLEQLKQDFDELRREMTEENILSDETLQKYEELQRLMEEIDDPAIQEMLEKLREGLENMDQDQIRDAMRELEFNEQAYQERLERTLELFKQLRLNAELDKMTAMLEELERLEERIMDMEDPEEQLQQQENVREQLENLQQQLDELPDKSPQRRQQMVDDMVQELQPQMQDISDQIQENIDELGSPQMDQDQSRQQQQQIQQGMSEMREQMSQLRQQMNQASIQVNTFALKSIFQTLLLLSEAQEELNVNTLRLEPNSLAFIDHARIQRNISMNFNQVVDSLLAVSKEVPQFPNLILKERLEVQRSLEQSMEHLVERNKNRATTSERVALGGINKLAGLVADLLDQLDDDGDGGGGGGMSADQMMQQMQDMGEQQQQLNQMIQDFINDMAGDRLSQDQMERLDQMARQQNEIRRQLRELQQRGALESGDPLLSELERLAEEMEDAINDIRGGSMDELMVERQQNILSRMLQAERALDEREEDEERRGETAEEYQRSTPPEMTLEELEREIRNRLQDPDQTRFTEDYQRLIRLYFEILREREGSELPVPD